jgi:transposase-like protein
MTDSERAVEELRLALGTIDFIRATSEEAIIVKMQSDLRTGEAQVVCERCSQTYDFEEAQAWIDHHNITRRQFFLCGSCRRDFQADWLKLKRAAKGTRGSLYRHLFARRV